MNLHRWRCSDERRELLLIVMMSLVLAGCGGEARTTVEGKVTYKDQPLTSGLINFQLNNGPVFGGAIGSDGSYSYEMPPGEYQVRIDAPGVFPPWKEGDPPPKEPKRLAPAEYASYATSNLKASIKDDSPQEVNFPLQ